MRQRFDQFAKRLILAFGAGVLDIETEVEVSPDPWRIDVWIRPKPGRQRRLERGGLLGRMCRWACTVEVFHDAPDVGDIMGCLTKHHVFREKLSGETDRKWPLPLLWIVSAGRPTGALVACGFRRWRRKARGISPGDAQAQHERKAIEDVDFLIRGRGLYVAVGGAHTCLLVLSELPRTRATLLMRLMGRGKVLREAIRETKRLPPTAEERRLAMPLWMAILAARASGSPITKEEEDMLADLTDFERTARRKGLKEGIERGLQRGVKRGLQQGVKRGLQQGVRLGLREAVLALYETRFGAPPRVVTRAVAATDKLSVLRQWLKLVGTRTREETRAKIAAR